MENFFVKLASGRTFECSKGVTILESAAQSGITLPHSCKTGRCSTCKCRVIRGETNALVAEVGLAGWERAEGWILSCVRTALTDVVLDAEDLGDVKLPTATTQVCRVSSLVRMSKDVMGVALRLPPSSSFNFIPGQYIDVIGPQGVRRSYSVANAPTKGNALELHIRAVKNGAMTDYWFHQSRVGDLLRLHGPKGTFVLRDVAGRDLIFLATGTGLAPIKSMLEAISTMARDQRPHSTTLIWGSRREQDLYFSPRLISGIEQYIPVLSQADAKWGGERGYVQDVLLRDKLDFSNALVYACGSNSMISDAKSVLMAAGLPTRQFRSEAFVSSGTVS